MKRHFSNRGEALSDVTAARVLATRKSSVKVSFMTQAQRRASSPFWSPQRVEFANPRKRKQPRRNEGPRNQEQAKPLDYFACRDSMYLFRLVTRNCTSEL